MKVTPKPLTLVFLCLNYPITLTSQALIQLGVLDGSSRLSSQRPQQIEATSIEA
jgi:hypothetical protein